MTSIPAEVSTSTPSSIPRKATVTTDATVLWGRATETNLLLVNRDLLTTVYVGDANVTPANGIPLAPGGSISVSGDRAWYAATATGTAEIWAMPGGSSYTPPADTPTGAASVTAASSGLSTSVTVIAAPGAAQALKLYAGSMTINIVGTGSGVVQNLTITLQRSDTGSALWSTTAGHLGTNTTPENLQVPIDLQGVRLPLNVGVVLNISAPGIPVVVSATVNANLNYAITS